MCSNLTTCSAHFTPDFSVKNIKVSLKVNHQFDITKLPPSVSFKKHTNFFVINDKYTYIVFNKNKRTGQTHVNITKLKTSLEIEPSVAHLFTIFSIPTNLVYKTSVDNITSVGQFTQKINICNFVTENTDLQISFNPEKFPGIFIRFKKGTIILFASGSSVIVGGKDTDSMKNIVTEISRRLCRACIATQ